MSELRRLMCSPLFILAVILLGAVLILAGVLAYLLRDFPPTPD